MDKAVRANLGCLQIASIASTNCHPVTPKSAMFFIRLALSTLTQANWRGLSSTAVSLLRANGRADVPDLTWRVRAVGTGA